MPYINGRKLTLDNKQQANVLNPADGSTVGTIFMAGRRKRLSVRRFAGKFSLLATGE